MREGAIVLVKDVKWGEFHGCTEGLITAEKVEKETDEDERLRQTLRTVIVDTYVLMAKANGGITSKARTWGFEAG